jgi:Pectate lyase superfamily protein/Major tropism determinant N-terminal domain
MAIVSISRLQHRRGLLADLPANLNEAELGWCLDTRQLFIGNGNAYTGNSQILTQWSPNDQLITHTYQGYTGVTANTAIAGSPTVRTLNSILNDYLDVKDYGATGNGVTDDTVAIQNAIADEWHRIANSPYSALMSRNQIFFPAGNYLISSTILLYPYISLIGEGIDKTQITLNTGSSGPVFATADSLGQSGTNIGTNNAILPKYIVINGMTVNGSADVLQENPVIMLQRCTDTTINNAKLINSWTPGSGAGNGNNGIDIQSLGGAVLTGNINILNTTVLYAANAIQIIDPVTKVNIQNSTLYGSYNGVYLASNIYGSPNYITLRDSVIEQIDHNGLYADTNGAISSIGNDYITVGGGVNPSIVFTANTVGCQSIADNFTATSRDLRISNGSPGKNVIFDPAQTEVVNNTPTPHLTQLLPNQSNTPTNISWNTTGATTFSAFIDYSVHLGTYAKSGRITMISDGTAANLIDSAVDLNNTASVVFSVSIVSGVVTVNYTSTGVIPGSMLWIQTYWAL